MEVITRIDNIHAEALLSKLQENLRDLIASYGVAIPQGWRCIIKAYDPNNDLQYHLDFQSKRGGGEHAEDKLRQLESYPGHTMTSPDDFDLVLRELAQSEVRKSPKLAAALERLESTYQMMSQVLNDWLTGMGIVLDYGGIRVPYYFCSDDSPTHAPPYFNQGNLYISFDGALREQNLFFALAAAKALKQAYDTVLPDVGVQLDFHELRYHCETELWLRLLDL